MPCMGSGCGLNEAALFLADTAPVPGASGFTMEASTWASHERGKRRPSSWSCLRIWLTGFATCGLGLKRQALHLIWKRRFPWLSIRLTTSCGHPLSRVRVLGPRVLAILATANRLVRLHSRSGDRPHMGPIFWLHVSRTAGFRFGLLSAARSGGSSQRIAGPRRSTCLICLQSGPKHRGELQRVHFLHAGGAPSDRLLKCRSQGPAGRCRVA